MGRQATPRPVLVRWVDASMSTTSHWTEGDRPPPPSGESSHICKTVGWLVYSDKNWLQIVSTLADGAHAHLTEIPRGMVREIKALAGED
jgi:hypothetical protein